MKQKLQIRTACRKDQVGILADRSIECQTDIAGTEHEGTRNLILVAFDLLDVHDTTERISSVGGKGTGVKIHLPHKIHVDHANRSTRRSLRGEVVDVRHFDAIEEETVLVRGTVTDDDIVTKGNSRLYC